MQLNSELTALFSLIDDPDKEVFDLISKKIVTYGMEVIPCLEDLCESTPCDATQNRINEIIHQVNFGTLVSELQLWNAQYPHDLVTGSTLIARYIHPHLCIEPIQKAVEAIRKEIWLELNDYLTTLEMAFIVSKILFQFQKISSERNNYQHLEHFLLPSLLDKKKGNALSTGILYQYLCEQLEIPIKLISIPDQSILACFQRNYLQASSEVPYQQLILFYVDAVTGKVFSQIDLDRYFSTYQIKKKENFFEPMPHQKIMQKLTQEVGKCYLDQKHLDRKNDMDVLASLLR